MQIGEFYKIYKGWVYIEFGKILIRKIFKLMIFREKMEHKITFNVRARLAWLATPDYTVPGYSFN